MEEIFVSTFDELKEQVTGLLGKYGRHVVDERSFKNTVLFRGQADSTWKLESTLDRASKQNWTLKRYLRLIQKIRPIIESYYHLPFSEPSDEDIDNWFKNVAQQVGVVNIPTYDYLLYLRHYGFPSPLVDWTTSIYIAAGFAFFSDNTAESRAIYVFIETPTGIKGGNVGAPEINQLGPYVKTHKRHFLQQADYTICFRRAMNIPLEKYDRVITGSDDDSQDLLWKFIIPSKQRGHILDFLASVNINPFSLMPSEENLLSSLWLQEVVFDYEWALHNEPPDT